MRISFNVELNFEELKKKFEMKNRQSKVFREKDINLPALKNNYRNTQPNIGNKISFNSIKNLNENEENNIFMGKRTTFVDSNNNNFNIINNNNNENISINNSVRNSLMKSNIEKISNLNINNSSNQSVNISMENMDNNFRGSIYKENTKIYNDNSNNFESKNASIYSKKETIRNIQKLSSFDNDNISTTNRKKTIIKHESIKKNPQWFKKVSQVGFNNVLYSDKRSSNESSPYKTPGQTWFKGKNSFSTRRSVKEANEDSYSPSEFKLKPYEDKNADFFASLNKPKKKIQFKIFTEHNKNEEEIKLFQDNLKKLTKIDSPLIKSKSPKRIGRQISSTIYEFHPIIDEITPPLVDANGRKTSYGKAHKRESYSNSVKRRNIFKKNKKFILEKDEKKYNNSNVKTDANNNDKDDNGKKKRLKLPKIKQKLQTIYKVNPTIEKNIRSLKNTNQLTGKLEDYQQKLMNIAKNFLDHDNLKDLATKLKEVTELSSLKDKIKYHRSLNRWEIMVKQIARFIPEYLVETLKAQK
jgi:hypothetical protein